MSARTSTDVPVPSGDLAADWRAAGARLAEADAVLESLPPRPHRDPEQQRRAESVHGAARRVRQEFLRAHIDEVYAELVGSTRPRIEELALSAAEAFPHLVPSAEQLAAESRHVQADKEGREIDQGIFFHALLSSPRAGEHLIKSMLRPTGRARELLAEFRATGEVTLPAAHVRRDGDAAHVTITNEHCLNAEDNGHVTDMETAVDLALLDPGVRVGVLRGGRMSHPRYAGKRVFSAGINLKELHAGRISFVDFLLGRELGYINKLVRGLAVDDAPWPWTTVQKPWVAAVDSFAIGGGAQLLLVFDQVLAAENAYFSLPAANEGIVPGVSNLRLGRAVGSRTARQIVLGGRRIHAREPAAAALFDEVVEEDELDAAVRSAADRLRGPAVVANRHMLNSAEEPLHTFREHLAEFALHQSVRAYAPDVLAKVGRGTR